MEMVTATRFFPFAQLEFIVALDGVTQAFGRAASLKFSVIVEELMITSEHFVSGL
jgi:hypothetical protein